MKINRIEPKTDIVETMMHTKINVEMTEAQLFIYMSMLAKTGKGEMNSAVDYLLDAWDLEKLEKKLGSVGKPDLVSKVMSQYSTIKREALSYFEEM